MPLIYFKIVGRDCWHFHLQCQHMRRIKADPLPDVMIRVVKPRSGEFCNECQAKTRADKRTQARKQRRKP